MNRADLQHLARIRIEEARALLDRELFDGAYYLAGYAVECALKACIAKRTKRYEFPDKKIVERSYTHDLSQLLKASGLETEHQKQMDNDDRFALNWALVTEWIEHSRYKAGFGSKALTLYEAITDRQHGVLPWIRKFW